MGITAIILAGKRPGQDAVAAHFGESCKAFAPIGGQAMLGRVVAALAGVAAIDDIVIVGDVAGRSLDGQSLMDIAKSETTLPVRLIPPQPTISASVAAAVSDFAPDRRFFATTCDHALLTSGIVNRFLHDAAPAGLSVAMVSRDVIEASFPGMRRTYWRFRDQAVSGANLFAFGQADISEALNFFVRMEANRKKPLKVAAEFGLWNVLMIALRRRTLGGVFTMLSRKFGVRTVPILLPFATAAVDVDKRADIDTVEAILKAT